MAPCRTDRTRCTIAERRPLRYNEALVRLLKGRNDALLQHGGPCNPLYHYMLSADLRLHEENVMRLIEQQAYFILHALRQTGKTTAILELAQRLTASGLYIAAVVSLEVGAAFPNDVDRAEKAILGSWQQHMSYALGPDLQP